MFKSERLRTVPNVQKWTFKDWCSDLLKRALKAISKAQNPFIKIVTKLYIRAIKTPIQILVQIASINKKPLFSFIFPSSKINLIKL